MTRTQPRMVTLIGNGGEHGYLVRGVHTQAEAIALVIASGVAPDMDAESLGHLDYEPGWYRWNASAPGSEFAQWIVEGTAGRHGSFAAVYLARPA